MFSTFFRSVAFAGALLWVGGSQAGIVLNTTRVIYHGEDKEASFGVLNSGSAEILLQTWLESGADNGAQARPPFAVTPPLTRMPGNGRQLLRLIYAGSGLPQDRESVFWLNVQEIPQTAAENTLQLAVRQRIKVFFRPKGLKGDAQDAPQALQWRLAGNDAVLVENPGPYHVSMIRIAARQADAELAREDARMIAPGETVRLALNRKAGSGPVSLSFNSINDFGGQVTYQATLKPDMRTAARRAEPE